MGGTSRLSPRFHVSHVSPTFPSSPQFPIVMMPTSAARPLHGYALIDMTGVSAGSSPLALGEACPIRPAKGFFAIKGRPSALAPPLLRVVAASRVQSES